MKSQELKKISLAVLAAFALAACGSDGDGNNHTSSAATDTTAAQSDAAKKAAEQAAADKKAAEEAAKQAAADKKAAEDLMKKIEADKLAAEEKKKADEAAAAAEAANADHQQLTSKVKTKGESFVGFKNVVKNQSNFNTNSSSTTDSKADVPEGMNVQKPNPALDTIVVGEGGKKTVYLDNFKFGDTATNGTSGEATMNNVFVNVDTKTGSRTSTDKALVLQTNRVNYTNNYGVGRTSADIATPVSYNPTNDTFSATVVDVNAATAPNFDKTRTGADKLAEVYGNKTLIDSSGNNEVNTPFLDAPLQHVQYGRVTSALHGKDVKNMKAGLGDGSGAETVIGSYGKMGEAGTENHYFYRGTENTSAAQLADVKTKYAKFDYQGHAVSYGLDNNYHGGLGKGNNLRIPTALDSQRDIQPYAAFMSGNHVKAEVDFTNNKVNGSIYNVWFDGYKETTVTPSGTLSTTPDYTNGQMVPVNLVEFNGTLADNGNIAGTSTYKAAADNTSGVFGGTLFGANAAEMGGTVASDAKEPNKAWGATFGLKRVGVTPLSTYTPPAPSAPLPSIGNANNTTTPSNPTPSNP